MRQDFLSEVPMKWLKQLFCRHQWTNDAEEGISPLVNLETCSQADAFRYNRGWCKRCRRYQKPSIYLCGSEHWDAKVRYR